METVNGVSNGDKGGPPPPSPLTGCYLLVVVGEPYTEQHKDIILQRIAKGLLSWEINSCLVDLEKELAIITEQALEGEEARYGERLIQFASENLVTEILIHPVVSTLAQCMRNLLSSFTRHRHIIHSGYTFAANGSWALQDGTFSYSDFSEAFQEIDVQRVIHAYENGISVDLHCSPEGEWTRLPKEPFAKACRVRVNPTDVLTSGSPAIANFTNYLAPFLVPTSLENLLESSDVVGNIRFSRPTLYVFPGGQGDAALFGINGFNMLLDGGFSRKACFWDFVRHLDRLDAVLMTRLNNSNVGGISSVLRRKKQDAVYPQLGHFFCNIQERKALLSPDGDKDKDPLLVNLLDEGQEIISNLRHLNLNPQVCYRDSEPINLYHKVGHGTLDMYVLSPAKDSREVREFLQKWNQSDQKLFANSRSSREFSFPIQNLISIAALLVWQPANPNDTITRILFPGSSPQNKIFEGLDRLKNVEFIKHPVCTERSLVPISVTKKTAKDPIFEKSTPKEKTPVEKRDKIIENNIISAVNGDIKEKEKTVKKSDSTESDRSTKTKKTDEPRIAENGEKSKPKLRTSKSRSGSQQRKKAPEKKASPTTPKKTVENGESKKPPKPSPISTPAKSAKDANNRKVIESKTKREGVVKPQQPPEPKPKVERKPISRRPVAKKAPLSPAKKLVSGVQKPDSISRKGKLDKEGTTDSSTVSTPSADQETVLKKDLSKLTPEEIQQLKVQELVDLKEEQEAIKEIEAVFRKGETLPVQDETLRKVRDDSIDEKLNKEEYLIIEKEEVDQESLSDMKENETKKLARDSEESEKPRKLSSEDKTEEISSEIKKALNGIEPQVGDSIKVKVDPLESSELASLEDKLDMSTDKKTNGKEAKDDIKDVMESQPDEKISANIKSGDTTTAPTLPEDERIPLDEIKEDKGHVIEEKYIKEETKEKEIPVIQLPQKQLENISKLPGAVGIRLDKQQHIRDIVKTPDEVADLPVHEEVDYEYTHELKAETPKSNEILEKQFEAHAHTDTTGYSKEQEKEVEQEKDKDEVVQEMVEQVENIKSSIQKRDIEVGECELKDQKKDLFDEKQEIKEKAEREPVADKTFEKIEIEAESSLKKSHSKTDDEISPIETTKGTVDSHVGYEESKSEDKEDIGEGTEHIGQGDERTKSTLEKGVEDTKRVPCESVDDKSGEHEELNIPVIPTVVEVKSELDRINEELLKSTKEDKDHLEKRDEKLQKLKQSQMELEEDQYPHPSLSGESLDILTQISKNVEVLEDKMKGDIIVEDIGDKIQPKSPAEAIEKGDLGRKSPKEREEDVIKIVASVAEVLKSDAPLEEFEGKLPITTTISSYTSPYTTELRETHITTVDSPVIEYKVIKTDIPTIPEEPHFASASFIEEERKISEVHDSGEGKSDDKRSSLLKESEELMRSTSKMISDMKSVRPEEVEEKVSDDKIEARDESVEEEESGVIHRMLVTASSEDGGEETEICPPGTITFPRSSESSGRSSPDPSQKVSQKSSVVETISDTLSTVRQVAELQSEEESGIGVKTEEKSSPPLELKPVEVPEGTSAILEKCEEISSQIMTSGKSTPDNHASVQSIAFQKSTPDISDLEKPKEISSEDPKKVDDAKGMEDDNSGEKTGPPEVKSAMFKEGKDATLETSKDISPQIQTHDTNTSEMPTTVEEVTSSYENAQEVDEATRIEESHSDISVTDTPSADVKKQSPASAEQIDSNLEQPLSAEMPKPEVELRRKSIVDIADDPRQDEELKSEKASGTDEKVEEKISLPAELKSEKTEGIPSEKDSPVRSSTSEKSSTDLSDQEKLKDVHESPDHSKKVDDARSIKESHPEKSESETPVADETNVEKPSPASTQQTDSKLEQPPYEETPKSEVDQGGRREADVDEDTLSAVREMTELKAEKELGIDKKSGEIIIPPPELKYTVSSMGSIAPTEKSEETASQIMTSGKSSPDKDASVKSIASGKSTPDMSDMEKFREITSLPDDLKGVDDPTSVKEPHSEKSVCDIDVKKQSTATTEETDAKLEQNLPEGLTKSESDLREKSIVDIVEDTLESGITAVSEFTKSIFISDGIEDGKLSEHITDEKITKDVTVADETEIIGEISKIQTVERVAEETPLEATLSLKVEKEAEPSKSIKSLGVDENISDGVSQVSSLVGGIGKRIGDAEYIHPAKDQIDITKITDGDEGDIEPQKVIQTLKEAEKQEITKEEGTLSRSPKDTDQKLDDAIEKTISTSQTIDGKISLDETAGVSGDKEKPDWSDPSLRRDISQEHSLDGELAKSDSPLGKLSSEELEDVSKSPGTTEKIETPPFSGEKPLEVSLQPASMKSGIEDTKPVSEGIQSTEIGKIPETEVETAADITKKSVQEEPVSDSRKEPVSDSRKDSVRDVPQEEPVRDVPRKEPDRDVSREEVIFKLDENREISSSKVEDATAVDRTTDDILDKADHKIESSPKIESKQFNETESEIPKHVSTEKPTADKKHSIETVEEIDHSKDKGSPATDSVPDIQETKKSTREEPTEKLPRGDELKSSEDVLEAIGAVSEKEKVSGISETKTEHGTSEKMQDEEKDIVESKEISRGLEDEKDSATSEGVLKVVKHEQEDIGDKVSEVVTSGVGSTEGEIDVLKEDIETSDSSSHEGMKDISESALEKQIFEETTYSISILPKDTDESIVIEGAEDPKNISGETISFKDVEPTHIVDKPMEIIEKIDYSDEIERSTDPQKKSEFGKPDEEIGQQMEEKMPEKVEIFDETSEMLKDTGKTVDDISKLIILDETQKSVTEGVTLQEKLPEVEKKLTDHPVDETKFKDESMVSTDISKKSHDSKKSTEEDIDKTPGEVVEMANYNKLNGAIDEITKEALDVPKHDEKLSEQTTECAKARELSKMQELIDDSFNKLGDTQKEHLPDSEECKKITHGVKLEEKTTAKVDFSESADSAEKRVIHEETVAHELVESPKESIEKTKSSSVIDVPETTEFTKTEKSVVDSSGILDTDHHKKSDVEDNKTDDEKKTVTHETNGESGVSSGEHEEKLIIEEIIEKSVESVEETPVSKKVSLEKSAGDSEASSETVAVPETCELAEKLKSAVESETRLKDESQDSKAVKQITADEKLDFTAERRVSEEKPEDLKIKLVGVGEMPKSAVLDTCIAQYTEKEGKSVIDGSTEPSKEKEHGKYDAEKGFEIEKSQGVTGSSEVKLEQSATDLEKTFETVQDLSKAVIFETCDTRDKKDQDVHESQKMQEEHHTEEPTYARDEDLKLEEVRKEKEKISERRKSVIEQGKEQEKEHYKKSDSEKDADEEEKSDGVKKDEEDMSSNLETCESVDGEISVIETVIDDLKKVVDGKSDEYDKADTESSSEPVVFQTCHTKQGSDRKSTEREVILEKSDKPRKESSDNLQGLPQLGETYDDTEIISKGSHQELSDTKKEVEIGKKAEHEKLIVEKSDDLSRDTPGTGHDIFHSIASESHAEICKDAENLSMDISHEKPDSQKEVDVDLISDKVIEQEKLSSEKLEKLLKDAPEADEVMKQSTASVSMKETSGGDEEISAGPLQEKSDAEKKADSVEEQGRSSTEKRDESTKTITGGIQSISSSISDESRDELCKDTEKISKDVHHEKFDTGNGVSVDLISDAVTQMEEPIEKISDKVPKDSPEAVQAMSASVVTETSGAEYGVSGEVPKDVHFEKSDTEKKVDSSKDPGKGESIKDATEAVLGISQVGVDETSEKTCEKTKKGSVDEKPDSEMKVDMSSKSDENIDQENLIQESNNILADISETVQSRTPEKILERSEHILEREKFETEKNVDDSKEVKQGEIISKKPDEFLDDISGAQDTSQSSVSRASEGTSMDVHHAESVTEKKVEVPAPVDVTEKAEIMSDKSDKLLETCTEMGVKSGGTCTDVYQEKSDIEKEIIEGAESTKEESILEKSEKFLKDISEQVQGMSQTLVFGSGKKTEKPDITDKEKSDPEKDVETSSESGEHIEHMEKSLEKTAEELKGTLEEVADMSGSIIFEKCGYSESKKSVPGDHILEKQEVTRTGKVEEALEQVGDMKKADKRQTSDAEDCIKEMTDTSKKGSETEKQNTKADLFSSTDGKSAYESVELEKGEEETMEKYSKEGKTDSSTIQQSLIPDISKQKLVDEASKETVITLAGPSIAEKSKTEKQKHMEIEEFLLHEKHIPGAITPPTVPVSPNILDETIKITAGSQHPLKGVDLRSITPVSDDSEIIGSTHTDISEQVSKVHLDKDSDDEDQLSIMSQIAHSRDSSHNEFEEEFRKVDPMSMSLYGSLPGETKTEQEVDPSLLLEMEKTEHLAPSVDKTDGKLAGSIDDPKSESSHKDETSCSSISQEKKDSIESWGKPLQLPAPTYLYEITQAKFSRGVHPVSLEERGSAMDDHRKTEEEEAHHMRQEQMDVMSASFYGDLPSDEADPLSSWGKPLGLPSPAPPNDNKGTPKKERKLPPNVSAKNKLNDDRKRAESPSKYNNRNKKITPVYVDLTYVPHHGNTNYSYVDFFRRVRARYYVFSGIEPSRDVYNALLEAKQTWEDKDLEVTIIPTYDTDILGYWVAENEEMLTKYKIDLSPSASRCTINLQDHETSCSAYRLEF